MALKNSPVLEEHLQRANRLVCEFGITAHATPASKKHSSDLPGVVILRTEGKTSEVDAIEDGITWTAADDNDGAAESTFGLLVNLGDDPADKVYSLSITEVSAVSTSEVLSSPTGVTAYLTENGNIAVEIVATGLDLETESPTFRLEVEYRQAR